MNRPAIENHPFVRQSVLSNGPLAPSLGLRTAQSYGDRAECYNYTEHNTELRPQGGVLYLHRVTATECYNYTGLWDLNEVL